MITLSEQIQQLLELVSTATLDWKPIPEESLEAGDSGNYTTAAAGRYAICVGAPRDGVSVLSVIDQSDASKVIFLNLDTTTNQWHLLFRSEDAQTKLNAVLMDLRGGHLRQPLSRPTAQTEPHATAPASAPAATSAPAAKSAPTPAKVAVAAAKSAAAPVRRKEGFWAGFGARLVQTFCWIGAFYCLLLGVEFAGITGDKLFFVFFLALAVMLVSIARWHKRRRLRKAAS